MKETPERQMALRKLGEREGWRRREEEMKGRTREVGAVVGGGEEDGEGGVERAGGWVAAEGAEEAIEETDGGEGEAGAAEGLNDGDEEALALGAAVAMHAGEQVAEGGEVRRVSIGEGGRGKDGWRRPGCSHRIGGPRQFPSARGGEGSWESPE